MVCVNETLVNQAVELTKRLFPAYVSSRDDPGIINPLKALELGKANCAIRTFSVGVILESFGLKPKFSIHSSHAEDTRQEGLRYGHTHNMLGGIAIVSTTDADRIEVIEYDKDSPWYVHATILPDSTSGLLAYADMHPELPEVDLVSVERAKLAIQSRV